MGPKGEIEFDSIQVYDRTQQIRVSVRNIESRQNKALSVIEACRSLNTSPITFRILLRNKFLSAAFLGPECVIECMCINYNVELVVT